MTEKFSGNNNKYDNDDHNEPSSSMFGSTDPGFQQAITASMVENI